MQYTTDLCIAAHPDDIELMAYPAIYDCFKSQDRFFTGIVLTDGASCGKGDLLQDKNDYETAQIRKKEQLSAAEIGKYLAVSLLSYSSAELRCMNQDVIKDIADIIKACKPDRIYIHNFADKHDTHVAAAVAAYYALHMLDETERPQKVYSMEVWRSLDWVKDESKAIFSDYGNAELEKSLITVFESQIIGNKSYDKGILGRRAANAVFLSGYHKDNSSGACYGMDLTDFIYDRSPAEIMELYINEFKDDVMTRLERIINRS